MKNIKKTMLAAMLLITVRVLGGDGKVARFVIKSGAPQQTIEHFGASDAWSMQFIGLWSEDEQRKTADWLFSMDTDAQGKPLGIGLSIWRFNLGAGSAEQGDASQINPGTRTECLLQPDGTYDWGKQAGQRKFLRMAKERGVNKILAFLNSPPVYYTQNGLATNTGRGGTLNLRPECYEDVARFVTKSIKGIKEHDGVSIDYFCPVNEPDGHWNWTGPKQEGTPATNREVARLAKAIDRQFSKDKIDTRILVNESSDLRCLLATHQTDWTRGYAIRTLFSPDSTETYLGKLKHVPHLIAAHSYWTNTPLPYMKEIRKQLRDTLKHYGLDFWQTETCIMSNDEEIGGGGGYDFSMKTALYVARIIHHDLVFANARSWQWWRAAGGDYRDGLLRMYPGKDAHSGTVVDSKLLWAMGNYSRFIRPGAVRHDIAALDAANYEVDEGYNDVRGVMCSAYRNTDGKWVVVAINYSQLAKPFRFAVDKDNNLRWKAFRTSNILAECLLPVGETDGNAVLSPRSITTFVSE